LTGQKDLVTPESHSACGSLSSGQTTNFGGQRNCCGASVTSFSVPFSKLRGTIAAAFYKSVSDPQAKLMNFVVPRNPLRARLSPALGKRGAGKPQAWPFARRAGLILYAERRPLAFSRS